MHTHTCTNMPALRAGPRPDDSRCNSIRNKLLVPAGVLPMGCEVRRGILGVRSAHSNPAHEAFHASLSFNPGCGNQKPHRCLHVGSTLACMFMHAFTHTRAHTHTHTPHTTGAPRPRSQCTSYSRVAQMHGRETHKAHSQAQASGSTRRGGPARLPHSKCSRGPMMRFRSFSALQAKVSV